MPGDVCIACNDKKRRPDIDTMLKQGAVISDVERRFRISHESLRRHARNCLGIPGRSASKKATSQAPAAAPIAATTATEGTYEPPVAAVAVEPIRDPEAVHSHLEWVVAKSRTMHAEAEANKDWRLANAAMTQVVNALDKIARSVGMYTDANTVIHIDQRTQKVAQFYETLPNEMLARLSSGDITIEQVMAAAGATP